MKDASRILYKVGRVFSIINFVMLAFLMFISVAGIAMKDQVFQKMVEQGTEIASVEELVGILVALMIVAVISLVLEIFRFKFAAKAIADLETKEKKAHIVVLVLSVINTSIFYLLASIFGLVVASKTTPNTTGNTSNDANVQ